MSYRLHIAVVDKPKSEVFRTAPKSFFTVPDFKRNEHPEMTESEIENAEYEIEEQRDEKVAFYQLINTYGAREDFCIGRLNIPKDIGQPFYLSEGVQDLFSHYNPRVLDKEDFAHIIDIMRMFVLKYYTSVLKEGPLEWKKVIRDKQDTWQAKYVTPYDLDTSHEMMTNSFDAEYQIWDMVRMFRSVNWETETVVFFGW